jgi:hypothetical protein
MKTDFKSRPNLAPQGCFTLGSIPSHDVVIGGIECQKLALTR